MTRPIQRSRCWRPLKFLLTAVLIAVALREVYFTFGPDPEIALILGEPWEDMRARSSASINPTAPRPMSHHRPSRDARLKFVDAQYGFITPKAKNFAIRYIGTRVAEVRMSTLGGSLSLDDALKVVLDLQSQWRAGGWHLLSPDQSAFEDTPQSRQVLLEGFRDRVVFWQAADENCLSGNYLES